MLILTLVNGCLIMLSKMKNTPALLLGLILTLSSLSAIAETTAQTADPGISPEITDKTNPVIIYQQALNYLLGRAGTEKSAEKAASLFKLLAEQNWSSAQHMLGNMYLRGKGVEKNDLLAYKWLSLASKNNLQLAKVIHNKRQALYENLQSNLSVQSLNKVETWIAEWKPANDRT